MKNSYLYSFILVMTSLILSAFIPKLGFSQCTNPPSPIVIGVSGVNCSGAILNFQTGGGSATAVIIQYDDNPSFLSPTQEVVNTNVTSLSVASAPGTTIYWRIRAVDCTGTCTCFSSYVSGTSITIPACPATSDNCAGAISIPFQVNGAGDWTCSTTTGATASAEANPTCWSSNTLEDVWYKVTITGNDLLVTTDQSINPSMDSQVALYASCGSAALACSMDATLDYYGYFETTTGATTVLNGATNGATYFIRVDGDAAADGFFCLKATGIAANNCYSNAITLADATQISGTTYGASEDCDGAGGTSDCDLGGVNSLIDCGSGGGASVENNVWYLYNCGATGSYTLTLTSVTCNGENGLQVWAGLDQALCSDYNLQVNDGGSGEVCDNTAAISSTMVNNFTCNVGEVVRISVDGFAAEMCSYNIEVTQQTSVAPVANNDNLNTNEDTPVTGSISNNDVDADGTLDLTSIDLNPSTAGIQSTMSNAFGTWSVNTSGMLTYTPIADFNGTATLTYTIKDNQGLLSNVATITVTVAPINDAPVAVNDNASTPYETAVSFSVSNNDSDLENSVNASTVDLNPTTPGIQNSLSTADGNWSVDASGNVTFTPNSGFSGSTSINYTINDQDGGTSNIAVITVVVGSCIANPNADCDGDGLSNGTETSLGTNPNLADTDGDGLTDGEENLGVDQVSTTAIPTGTSNPLDPCDPFGVNAGISISGNFNLCAGESVTITTPATGSLSWSTGATGSSIVINSAGTYSLTVSQGNCTVTSATLTVSIVGGPGVSAGSDVTICEGSSASITASSGSNVSYSWNTGASTPQINVSPLTTTVYSVTATDLNTGCISTDDIQVVVTPLPVISTSFNNPSSCGSSSGSITVSGSGSGNLVWTGPSSGSTNVSSFPHVIGNLPAGSYHVHYTASGCTSAISSVSLTDPGLTPPTISLSGPSSFCQGGSVILTSSESTGNTWTTGETSQSIVVTQSGSYAVTFSTGSCTATSNAFFITVIPNPVISIGVVSEPTSCGANDGSIEVLGSGSGSINWTASGSGNSGSASNVLLPFIINGLEAGTYNIDFNNGCPSNIVNASLNSPGLQIPIITASGSTTFCDGDNVTLTSSASTGNTWSNGATTQSIVVTQSGIYTVTNDNGSCSATSAALSISALPNPVISLGAVNDPSVCGANDGSIEVIGSSNGLLVWIASGNGTSGSANGTSLPSTITGLAPDTYTITFNDFCASNALTAVITETILNAPVLTVSGNLTFCEGDSVILVSSETNNNIWSTGENTQEITVKVSGDYFVSLDNGFCSANSDTVTVTMNPLPNVELTGLDTLCISEAAFTLNYGSPAGGVYQVNGSAAVDFDPSQSPGDNLIVYSFTDGNGCNSSASGNLFVDHCGGTDDLIHDLVYVSPNPSSGYFKLSGEDLNQYQDYMVFDALGRMVLNQKTTTHEFNLSNFTPGLYTLLVRGNAHQMTFKLVVQH